MSDVGLAGALISPIIDALANVVRQHGEARAREEAARVEAMLREPLATPRPIDEVIAEARGVDVAALPMDARAGVREMHALDLERPAFVQMLAAHGVDVVVDPSLPPSEWRIETRRVSEVRAATEARVSAADVDVLRRLASQHALTLEERGSVARAAHWMGARLAIPMPTRLDSEGEP